MAMERLNSVSYPPNTRKLRPEQIAQRSNWDKIASTQATQHNMHIIRTEEKNGSTETTVNPVDPDGANYIDVPKPYAGVTGVRGGFFQ